MSSAKKKLSPPKPSVRGKNVKGKGITMYYDERAVQVSNSIDEDLKKEYATRREARRKQVKVLLLGQAESGKSTLQKQFQYYFSCPTLDSQRPSWRPIVYSNIIKAIRMIFDELDLELGPAQGGPEHQIAGDAGREIALLRMKLLPLVSMEGSLASEQSGTLVNLSGKAGLFVRSGWQESAASDPSTPVRGPSSKNLVAKTLLSLREEIGQLWHHPLVRKVLYERKLRLEESAPFFLDNIYRISEPDYLPTIDDILNVRLQTLGVIEHQLDIKFGGANFSWLMYDVGGARGQRQAWAPYFEDATAIIYLAPISAFDQYLEEDPRVNRIDDSLHLFQSVCSNKLLRNAGLVLLLNKVDILKQKLEAGVRVNKYITSYGDRPNTFSSVADYFKGHFMQVQKKNDETNRVCFVHFTSMLDIKATQCIVADVGEAILRKYLNHTGLA